MSSNAIVLATLQRERRGFYRLAPKAQSLPSRGAADRRRATIQLFSPQTSSSEGRLHGRRQAAFSREGGGSRAIFCWCKGLAGQRAGMISCAMWRMRMVCRSPVCVVSPTGWASARISGRVSVVAGAALAFRSGPGQFDVWINRQEPLPCLLDNDCNVLATQSALPDDSNAPTHCPERLHRLPVPLDIAGKLVGPEPGIAGRSGRETAIVVPVPEAAMHENCRIVLLQHKVRLARQVLGVEPETESEGMEFATQAHFRACIPRPDATHHARARCRINDVGQKKVSRISVIDVAPRGLTRQ